MLFMKVQERLWILQICQPILNIIFQYMNNLVGRVTILRLFRAHRPLRLTKNGLELQTQIGQTQLTGEVPMCQQN